MLDKRTFFGVIAITAVATCLVRCGRYDSGDSEPKFTIGLSLYDQTRGHEDLTRFAVDLANQHVKAALGLTSYFTKIPIGENGGRSSLPMIKGSFDTDWALTMVTGHRSGPTLLDFYGVSSVESGSEWQELPWLQSLHFLRDRDAYGQTFGVEESLDRAREKVTKAFEQAIRVAWDRDQAFYWLGHALHMVQDSFSTVHTQRSADYRRISNLCVFGVEPVDGACDHPKPLSFEGAHPITGSVFEEDRIWRPDSVSCNHNPRERRWDCLKSEAKKASEVSAGLLALYATIVGTGVDAPTSDGYQEITDFLTKSNHWQGGYFTGSWE